MLHRFFLYFVICNFQERLLGIELHVYYFILDEVACADSAECMKACKNPVGCSNIAYPKLVLGILPNGKKICCNVIIVNEYTQQPVASVHLFFSIF